MFLNLLILGIVPRDPGSQDPTFLRELVPTYYLSSTWPAGDIVLSTEHRKVTDRVFGLGPTIYKKKRTNIHYNQVVLICLSSLP